MGAQTVQGHYEATGGETEVSLPQGLGIKHPATFMLYADGRALLQGRHYTLDMVNHRVIVAPLLEHQLILYVYTVSDVDWEQYVEEQKLVAATKGI